MKLKSILLLLMLASPLMLLPAIPVSAQPPPFISNAFIVLNLGDPERRGPATSTIIDMGPPIPPWPWIPRPLAIDLVFHGEYEYLSTSGPPPANVGGPWPGPMVPLFGPGVSRVVPPGGYGATWYSVIIGPVIVAGVNVTVIKIVRVGLPGAPTWGWAQLDYYIIPNGTIPQLWLYYSIDYNDAQSTHCPQGKTNARIGSFELLPWPPVIVWQPLSIQPPPVPMPTPPGGGLVVDTKGSGWGVMMSWNWSYNDPPGPAWIPASTFNVWRYCGLYNASLWPDWYGWPNNVNITQRDCTGAFCVDLGAVGPAGVRCNQLCIGGIWGPPDDTWGGHEPPIPPVPLTACFRFKDPWFTPQILVNVTEHSVRRICPIAGKPVTFDASSSFDLNSTHTIIAYEWDFGDGTPPFNTTIPTIEHTYPDLGYNYEVNVSLIVYCSAGETAHAEGTMIIAPPPVGGIVVPVDKFVLLAPYIALASTILAATAATAIYVKRRNKKQ